MSEKYEYWRKMYMINGVSRETLSRLAEGKILTQDEVETIISERMTEQGY